ncbi:hypothetical protein QFZ94_003834 [Paraburkholderia sp. JPY465]|uniref:hypothetical protein n=1 Tax=Paraburkholderia sp. JPY465 TaxID=3042285 RepID=UPI003D1EE00A
MTTFKIFDVSINEQFGIGGGENDKPEAFSFIVGKVKVSDGDFDFLENTPLGSLSGRLMIYADDDDNPVSESVGIIRYLEFGEFTKFEIKFALPHVQYERLLLLGARGRFPNSLDVEIKGADSPILKSDVFKHRLLRGVVLSTALVDSEIDPHLYL